jgi:hypothetical protein
VAQSSGVNRDFQVAVYPGRLRLIPTKPFFSTHLSDLDVGLEEIRRKPSPVTLTCNQIATRPEYVKMHLALHPPEQ